MNTPTHRLYRSRSDRMIAGVCGGLAQFLGIDPTVVRLVFVLSLVLFPGPFPLLAYVVLFIIVPEEPGPYSIPSAPTVTSTPEETPAAPSMTDPVQLGGAQVFGEPPADIPPAE